MIDKTWFIYLIVFLFLTGCGASSNVIKNYHADKNSKLKFSLVSQESIDVPNEVLETMRTQIQTGLSERNILASSGDERFRKATILITAYRMRPNAARLLVGILAGCDTIKSNVIVVDQPTSITVGESELEYEECAAWGVASQVISAYTESVVEYLVGEEE